MHPPFNDHGSAMDATARGAVGATETEQTTIRSRISAFNKQRYVDAALVATGFRTIRGYVRPRTTQLALLRSLSSAQVSDFGQGIGQLINAGILMAETRMNHLDSALQRARKIDAEGTLAAGPDSVGDAAFILEAALATTYIAAAVPAEALPHAVRLAELAVETDQHDWLYRAHAFAAAVYAHSGDMAAADRALDEMDSAIEKRGIARSRVGLAEFIASTAECVIGFTRMDGELLQRLERELDPCAQQDPAAKPLLQLVRGLVAMCADDSHEALFHLARVTSGPERELAPRLIRGFAMHVQSLIHTARGEYEIALTEVQHLDSSPDHFLCSDFVRATAHIGAEDYPAVLRATNDCIRIRAEHNLWSLGPILLRRAIAHLHLGNRQQALLEGLDAVRHADPGASALLFVSLPPREIDALFSFLSDERPDVAAELLRLRSGWSGRSAAPASHDQLPRLTEREAVVAHRLAEPLSLARIAERLNVSPGTVKSQAHSIYRKLGVNTREEAVLELGRRGFYSQLD